MENKVFYTEKALEEIKKAHHEALQGNEAMTYYHIGRLDAFLYLLYYPTEFQHVINDIHIVLAKNKQKF